MVKRNSSSGLLTKSERRARNPQPKHNSNKWNSHISSPWMRWFSNSWHFIFTITSLPQPNQSHFAHSVVSHLMHSFFCLLFTFQFLFYIDFSNCWLNRIGITKVTTALTCDRATVSSTNQHYRAECHDNTRRVLRPYGKMRIFILLSLAFRNRRNGEHK